MSTMMQRRGPQESAPARAGGDDARRLARSVKRWTLGSAVAAFGLAWALVSQDVVGATSAAPPASTVDAAPPAGRATVPSSDFFGQPAVQPLPILGNQGAAGSAPVVRGGTS